MILLEAIGQYLRTEADETIAIASTRSYWLYAPTNATLPYSTFRLASSRRLANHINGAGAPRESTIELICFAANQSAAWALAEVVKLNLDNYQGLMPSTGTVRVKKCVCTDESDLVSEAAFEAGVFAVSLTFTVTT